MPLTTTFAGSDSESGVHAQHHDDLATAVNALQVQIPLSLAVNQLVVGNTTAQVIQDSGLTWDNTAKTLIASGAGGLSTTLITVSTAVGKLIPGATSFSHRNNADTADNLLITNAGLVTVRAGLTVTASGLRVTAGNLGVGAAAAVDKGIYVNGAILASSTTQYGILVDATPSAAATGAAEGITVRAQSNASAYTVGSVTDLRLLNPTKGAGSTITIARGINIDAITAGDTSNYGIDIATPSGGATDNLSLRATGAIRFSGLGAFAASDHYVVIDSSGNLHKSAIGPAS